LKESFSLEIARENLFLLISVALLDFELIIQQKLRPSIDSCSKNIK
jgi:hypothetical protein